MEKDLIREITALCGKDSRHVVNTLYSEGLLNNNSIRNYLIRRDFDNAIKSSDAELIKHIFLDISEKYAISVRQTQRVVYDYMKNKVSSNGNTINK
tara:strand:- start:3867 stop:4154 length:288 start_codon:yes stop_codon:yes gene_type:complete